MTIKLLVSGIFAFICAVAFANQDGIGQLYPIITEPSGKDFERLMEGLALQPLVETKGPQIAVEIRRYEAAVVTKEWPVSSPRGRMTLPVIVITRASGILPFFDADIRLDRMAQNDSDKMAILRYAISWNALLSAYPNSAFQEMVERSRSKEVNTIDILRLHLAIGGWPGERLQQDREKLTKSSWEIIHASKHPCYRFIALEKLDSVEQSPAELLALYRECLFGACSYLEARAFEAITSNKDFREDVAKLLEEYIATSPPANDGTLPSLRNKFPHLIKGAEGIIAIIRNSGKPDAQAQQQSSPLAQSAAQSKQQPSEVKPVQSSEKPVSTPWIVWGVLIAAATGLLWLLLKSRK